jgi:hypothetical protein
MLKFFELAARFPRREDVPRVAVEFMAGQVKVDVASFASYDWSGARTAGSLSRGEDRAAEDDPDRTGTAAGWTGGHPGAVLPDPSECSRR